LPHFGVNRKTTSNSTDFLCLKFAQRATTATLEDGMEDGTPLSGQQTNKPAFQISPRILVSLQKAP
jgi:hypothetical protein